MKDQDDKRAELVADREYVVVQLLLKIIIFDSNLMYVN